LQFGGLDRDGPDRLTGQDAIKTFVCRACDLCNQFSAPDIESDVLPIDAKLYIILWPDQPDQLTPALCRKLRAEVPVSLSTASVARCAR